MLFHTKWEYTFGMDTGCISANSLTSNLSMCQQKIPGVIEVVFHEIRTTLCSRFLIAWF